MIGNPKLYLTFSWWGDTISPSLYFFLKVLTIPKNQTRHFWCAAFAGPKHVRQALYHRLPAQVRIKTKELNCSAYFCSEPSANTEQNALQILMVVKPPTGKIFFSKETSFSYMEIQTLPSFKILCKMRKKFNFQEKHQISSGISIEKKQVQFSLFFRTHIQQKKA